MKTYFIIIFILCLSCKNNDDVTQRMINNPETITLGQQTWYIENANVKNYRDGTPIPRVDDSEQWDNLTTGAYCYYDNDPSKGILYNWFAIMGIHDDDPATPNKIFAPETMKVPTDMDWLKLQEYLITNGYNYDGTTEGKKNSKSYGLPREEYIENDIVGSPGNDQDLNNSSGFNAYPYGGRYFSTHGYVYEKDYATFWSATSQDNDLDSPFALYRVISSENIVISIRA